jgi:dihydrofolate reductase
MKKIISFMHISLDGFVAGPNGEMNWIKVDEEIFDHVGKRISEGDTALYGRITYQMMENYWPAAGDKPARASTILNIQSGITTFTKLFYQKQ